MSSPTRAEVNARLGRVDIRDKGYVGVDQRVLGFWELYPEGRITTEVVSDDGERCTVRACAWDGERLLATGHAFEERTASKVNRTSYLENCETSAVGRALGILGIGSAGSVASAEEVSGAAASREEAEVKGAKRRLYSALKAWCRANGVDVKSELEEIEVSKHSSDAGWMARRAAYYEEALAGGDAS